MDSAETDFQPKIEAKRPRKRSSDFPCAIIFYASCAAQLALSYVIFKWKNTETVGVDDTNTEYIQYTCPSGYVFCESADGGRLLSLLCMTDKLCQDLKECASSRRLSEEHVSFSATGTEDAMGVWDFLEQHPYQPTVLFASLLIISFLWLFAMRRMPRGVVWGTLMADIALMVAVCFWFYLKAEVVNIICIVLAAGMMLFCVACRKKIETACVILKTGMDGLSANRRIFLVTFGVQLVWAVFFALGIAAIITRHFVKEVSPGVDGDGLVVCGLQEVWLGDNNLGLYFVLHYYWFTYFMRNINVMIITANISGWYFAEDDYESNWARALTWSVCHQAGGNAIASAVMGFLEYLLNRVGSTWKLVFALLNPLDWILLCIGLALKSVAMTYTKFGVIAMTFSGQSFCEAAPKALALMKGSLGDCVVTDYVGRRIMAWCTYIIAVGAGFAMWGWADSVQDISTLSALGSDTSLLMPLIVWYAWMVSYPFFGFVFVVYSEQAFSGADLSLDERKALNSVSASLFVGCISYFVLDFLSGVVVSAMDVSLFCVVLEKKFGQTQPDRFSKLYSSIDETFALGTVFGSDQVVIGTGVDSQDTRQFIPNPIPYANVVGRRTVAAAVSRE